MSGNHASRVFYVTGSPAIDQGNSNAVSGLGLATDQRGFSRTVDFAGIPNVTGGDGSDIGAVEAQVCLGNRRRRILRRVFTV